MTIIKRVNFTQNYSIADAKTHLPRIIHEVQASKEGVHLTRYGKPVAVILSEQAYASLRRTKPITGFSGQ